MCMCVCVLQKDFDCHCEIIQRRMQICSQLSFLVCVHGPWSSKETCSFFLMSSVCDERGQDLSYANVPTSEVVKVGIMSNMKLGFESGYDVIEVVVM